MSHRRMLIILISVYLSLALIIYLGATLIPAHMDSKKERLKQENFFLTHDKRTISNSDELKIAQRYEVLLDKLLNEFRKDLTELALAAYQEYKTLKAEDPNISPYSLAGKYMRKLRRLEENYDSKFNGYIETVMKEELKANSLSFELVHQARYAYNVKKKQIKKEFYHKGKKLIGQN